jgi:hypothetical protein
MEAAAFLDFSNSESSQFIGRAVLHWLLMTMSCRNREEHLWLRRWLGSITFQMLAASVRDP